MRTGKVIRSILAASLGAGVLVAGAGCESHAGEGALIGGAAGAGLGAIIGHNSHNRTAEGALIGGAVGAVGGGLLGNEIDKKERYERDRYAYEQGYDDGRYAPAPPAPPPPPRRRYYEERYAPPPPPPSYRGDGYYEYRETRVYRR
jgi:hypothetical protein